MKKFEDFLNRMQVLLDEAKKHGHIIVRVEDLENAFPELKEHEDERIRKALIRLHKSTIEVDGIKGDDIITWLEKQGEQKSADKAEPKFKNGQWIVWQNQCYKVAFVNGCGYDLILQNGVSTSLEYGIVDRSAHIWTIEDAKDGDVLASELCDSIILFGGIKDNNIDFYCDYDFSEIDIPGDRFAINNGQHYGNVKDSKDFQPATKEQRDLLFQKMKEAGYEFDFETKELKKIK